MSYLVLCKLVLGYNGLLHRGDDHVLEDTVEAVRAEVER